MQITAVERSVYVEGLVFGTLKEVKYAIACWHIGQRLTPDYHMGILNSRLAAAFWEMDRHSWSAPFEGAVDKRAFRVERQGRIGKRSFWVQLWRGVRTDAHTAADLLDAPERQATRIIHVKAYLPSNYRDDFDYTALHACLRQAGLPFEDTSRLEAAVNSTFHESPELELLCGRRVRVTFCIGRRDTPRLIFMITPRNSRGATTNELPVETDLRVLREMHTWAAAIEQAFQPAA